MLLQFLLTLLLALASISSGALTKKNVVVIMSDDQDMLLDSLTVMPNVKKYLGDQGALYNKHYCTVAVCCPSRVNFFTGRAAHNTNVTSLTWPYGGWLRFLHEGLNDKYLPIWLQAAGVRTYYLGKFMNGFTTGNHIHPEIPHGWDYSHFLLDPWTYNYHQSHWSSQGKDSKILKYPNVHTTLVTQQKAINAIDDAVNHDKPFFLMVAPVAPHNEMRRGTHAPPPPPEFEHSYIGSKSPRTDNYNPDVPSGASWVGDLPKLSLENETLYDKWHTARLQNIAGVDSMVGAMIERLQKHDLLKDTYVIYTTDNGFHIGNHRLPPGKRCPYEEDINIPLLIRGPDVAQNVKTNMTNSHTDMAPTIMKMLGVPLQDDFDGAAIGYTQAEVKAGVSNSKDHVNVEFWDWGELAPDGFRDPDNSQLYYNNTYKALRIVNPDYSFYYSKWCTNETEFYDMNADLAQMHNRLSLDFKGQEIQYYGRPEAELMIRLDALLLIARRCKVDSCRNPWIELFPNGEVSSLRGAMDAKYDIFFTSQPRISFQNCKPGYHTENEGNQTVYPYEGPPSKQQTTLTTKQPSHPTDPAPPVPNQGSPPHSGGSKNTVGLCKLLHLDSKCCEGTPQLANLKKCLSEKWGFKSD